MELAGRSLESKSRESITQNRGEIAAAKEGQERKRERREGRKEGRQKGSGEQQEDI